MPSTDFLQCHASSSIEYSKLCAIHSLEKDALKWLTLNIKQPITID